MGRRIAVKRGQGRITRMGVGNVGRHTCMVRIWENEEGMREGKPGDWGVRMGKVFM